MSTSEGRSRQALLLLSFFLLPLLGPVPALAQPSKAGVVTAVKGQSLAARASLPQPVALKFKDDVFLQDRIETREDSLVRILLGGKALVTIRELSVFTVTEQPGRAVVDLQRGTVAVGVARSLLKPGEGIEIRTPNAIAAVRGSSGLVETFLVGGIPTTNILTGEISDFSIALLVSPSAFHELKSYQGVTISGEGFTATISMVWRLTPGQILKVLKAGGAPLGPGSGLPDGVVNQLLQEAGDVAASLGGGGDGGGPFGGVSGLGLNANPCRNAPTACAPPQIGGPPPPRNNQSPPPPFVNNNTPPPFVNNNPPPGGGPPPPPPPPPPGNSFTPPGHGGGPPNSATNPNPNPGHGGIPPGQKKKL